MRTRQTFTISLPGAMAKQVEDAMRAEQRTRSELIREALRTYFRTRVVEASPRELAAIRKGRAEIAKGNFVTLEELLHGMDSPHRKTSGKRIKKLTRAR